jgi:hypothetical protein
LPPQTDDTEGNDGTVDQGGVRRRDRDGLGVRRVHIVGGLKGSTHTLTMTLTKK